VRLAQEINPKLEAAPAAAEGSVRSIKADSLIASAQAGDFIVSRTNAPLARLVLKFIRAGKAARIAGRKDLSQMIEKFILRFRTDDIGELFAKMSIWQEKEIAKLIARSADEVSIEDIIDKVEVVKALADGCETVNDVRGRLQTMFADPEEGRSLGMIVLTNTHKVKGLESKNVYLLTDTYKPSRSEEERNLYYVGITRAIENLYMVFGEENE